MSRRPTVRLATLALLALLVSACAGGSGSSSAKTLTIAVEGPFTGDAAVTGKQIMQGAELAVATVNQGGGVQAAPVKGATLALKQFDDKDDPATSATNARQIVSDGSMLAAVGAGFSDVSIAMAPIFERSGVAFLSTYGSSNKILDPPKKAVFVVPPTFDAYSYSVADMVGRQAIKSVGIIHLTGAYGDLIDQYFVKRCSELGINVLANEAFNSGNTDFNAQLLRIKASGPQALVMIGLIDSDSLIVKQMAAVGLHVPVFDPGGITFNQDFLTLAGGSSDGVTGNTPTDPQRATAATQDLVRRWSAAYGTKIVPDPGAFTYEAVTAIARALADGASGRGDLARFIHRVEISDTGVGALSFSSAGARVGGRLWVFQIRSGSFVFQTGFAQRGVFDLQEIPLER